MELTEQQTQILEFEAQWWKYAGVKDSEILTRFGMTSTRYYQVLGALIREPAAMAAAPMTVKRLARLRDARAAHRSARARGVVS